MSTLRRIAAAIALVAVVGLGSGLAPGVAQGASVPPSAAPAQLFGPPGWPGGFYFGPDFTSPYAGSPGYPYYRYGAYYGSAYGAPYPIYPGYGAYYGGAVGAAYPSYSSAGGVVFGDSWGGYYPAVGRCLYGASAGYGGSWTDPSSYGYYAPYC
jgi:hypothetical protein